MTDATTAAAIVAAIVTAIATTALAVFNKLYLKRLDYQVKTMTDQARSMEEQSTLIREQAASMDKQTTFMYENMEHDRLFKKHERLGKEMALLVGPLYARRNDPAVFSLRKQSQRGTEPDYQSNLDFVTFWDTINQYMYLNQSENLRSAFDNYNAAINNYFELQQTNKSPGELNKIQENFCKNEKPAFISSIEKRYKEIVANLKEIENKLRIQDEEAKRLRF